MINLSLQQGKFPESWKCSLVTPLIKKIGLEPIPKNYRPVSNLCYLSKLVEAAAMDQYVHHLEKKPQMPKFNAAYRKHQSTETILLRVYSDILNNMDKQHVSILVLLDCSAAFDTIDVYCYQIFFKTNSTYMVLFQCGLWNI